MIVTVTLNPAMDVLISPERFSAGEINRYAGCTYRPGGKGVNVSLLLHSLGMDTIAAGVAAGFTGREIVRLTEETGCRTDFLLLPEGCSRINMKIRTPDGQETDLNGEGPEVPLSALEELGDKIAGLQAGDTLVLSGSVPGSLPGDSYARLLARLHRDVPAVVDTSGEALRAALPCRPFLIKPNLEELGELFGGTPQSMDEIKACGEDLQRQGARNVAVTLGSRGALLLREDGAALFCGSVKGEALSTVGAGDSFVAGFLYGLRLHGAMEGALQWGTAAGAATAFTRGLASPEAVKALFPRTGNVHRV